MKMGSQNYTEDFIRELYIAYIPISFIITHTPRGDELETCTSLSTKIIKDTKNKRRINIDISTSVRLGTIAGIITNILTIPVDTVSMNLQISKSIKRMGIFEEKFSPSQRNAREVFVMQGCSRVLRVLGHTKWENLGLQRARFTKK